MTKQPAMRTVSVVIPTVGRPELSRAIESVREQVFEQVSVHVEIVVVFDTLEEPSAALRSLADVAIWTGGGRRGAFARQRGCEAASGDWIAFLDDDDEWLPHKLERQVLAAEGVQAASVVVACRFLEGEDPRSVVRAAPERLIAQDETVSDYLFARRSPTVRRNAIPTSTILVDRATAVERVSWDESLRRHQDWDWLVRVGDLDDSRVFHVPEALVLKTMGTVGSISATANWQDSLTWYDRSSVSWSRRARADFLVAQVLRYAAQARSWSGVRAVFSRLRTNRRPPSVPSLLLGLTGLVPRTQAQALFSLIARHPLRRSATSDENDK